MEEEGVKAGEEEKKKSRGARQKKHLSPLITFLVVATTKTADKKTNDDSDCLYPGRPSKMVTKRLGGGTAALTF